MKIALAQLNYHVGNFESNIARIIEKINAAKELGADLVVFAELAICGYPPRDFLEFYDFINQCYKGIETIAEHCKGIAAIVGCPSVNNEEDGKELFNSAFFLNEGKIQQIINKSLLPNYDVFDEYRYFEPNKSFRIIRYKGLKIALTICEDLWTEQASIAQIFSEIIEKPSARIKKENLTHLKETVLKTETYHIGDYGHGEILNMYTVCPMDELLKYAPDLMINIAASPFNYKHAEERQRVLGGNTKKYNIPLFYVNNVGAQTELIFDGGSMVINAGGEMLDEMKYFEEDFVLYNVKKVHKQYVAERLSPRDFPFRKHHLPSKIERIHSALVLGIKDYFRKLGFTKAILGLSGGIDSAVTLVLAADALGSENVRVLLMPSEFSSAHSVDDAIALAKNLNVQHDIVSIADVYNSALKSLKPIFRDLPFNIAEENIQARTRAIFLMGVSNKFGLIVLNTSNKSETSVGYGTLYGDMCGGLSVLGDVYKTEVYELAEFINSHEEIIPVNSILKAPSAELRANQKDSDSLPDYGILDKILMLYIEQRKGPREIIEMGYNEQLVKRVLKMVNANEYKRYQTPPILRVSLKAFGMGRRMPIEGKYLS